MNERFFLKLLLALFAGLIVAEVVVVALFGLRLELILFCFILAAALTGILVVVRLLLQQSSEVDSVSARRARGKRSDMMRDRLRDYSVDEEFLSGESLTRAKGSSSAYPAFDTHRSRNQSPCDTTTSIEEAIRVHAEMFGGLGQLLQMMEKIDDSSFGQLVKKAALGELSREEVIIRIRLMIHENSRDSGNVDGEQRSVLEKHSMERESFDEYIRRCMTGSEGDSECADGFSVELDSVAFSRQSSVPPANFSHDPKSVISSLKRAAAKS